MYKCCIFDLDGTLIDSIKAISYTCNLTIERFGYEPIDEEKYKIFVGEGYKKLVERALIYSGDKELRNYEAALKVYLELFEIYYKHEVKVYDGIKELLESLKENGVKIAVLSNKPHSRTIDNVNFEFGENYFHCVFGERKEVKRKPDPEGAIFIAKDLGVDIKECLYIGDTDTDMKTGISAGMDTIGVTWGFRSREELESYRPFCVVDKPKEIKDIVIKNK